MNFDTKTHSQTTGQGRRGVGQRGPEGGQRQSSNIVVLCSLSIYFVCSCYHSHRNHFLVVGQNLVVVEAAETCLQCRGKQQLGSGLTQADVPEKIHACTRRLNTDSVHHFPKERSASYSQQLLQQNVAVNTD